MPGLIFHICFLLHLLFVEILFFIYYDLILLIKNYSPHADIKSFFMYLFTIFILINILWIEIQQVSQTCRRFHTRDTRPARHPDSSPQAGDSDAVEIAQWLGRNLIQTESFFIESTTIIVIHRPGPSVDLLERIIMVPFT